MMKKELLDSIIDNDEIDEPRFKEKVQKYNRYCRGQP